MILAMMGSIWNSRKALTRMATAYSSIRSAVCRHAGHPFPYDQRVYVIGPLVGFYCFQVTEMAHNRVLVGDSVSTQKIAAEPCCFESDGDIVSLEHRNVGRFQFAVVLNTAGVQRKQLAL